MFSDVWVEEMEIKVILPEGCSDIKVNVPYEVEQASTTRFVTKPCTCSFLFLWVMVGIQIHLLGLGAQRRPTGADSEVEEHRGGARQAGGHLLLVQQIPHDRGAAHAGGPLSYALPAGLLAGQSRDHQACGIRHKGIQEGAINR